MTAIRLRLQGRLFSVRGPREALEWLPILYHESAIEEDPVPRPASEVAASFEVDRVDGEWRVTEDGSAAGSFDSVSYALLKVEHSIESHLLPGAEGWIAFHAGAAVIDDAACLLAGSADRGKSSSTLQLVELGHPFLAEEISAVAPDGRVHPHPQSIALDPRVVDELARERPLVRGRLDRIDDLVDRYMPHRMALEPVPLGTIALPAYRPGEPASIDEPRVESVLTELLGYCFEPPGDQEAAIDRVIEIASGVRLVRVGYPDAATARALFLDLFGSGGS